MTNLTTALKRFWEKVQVAGEDDCWEWTAYCLPNGYGRFGVGSGVVDYAHRVSYQLAYGEIPDGELVRHKCDNRKCVNSKHLVAGTPAQNSADMVERKRSSTGERNGQAKLTEADVCEIRRLRSSGVPRKEVADRFAIHPIYVSQITSHKFWQHLGE